MAELELMLNTVTWRHVMAPRDGITQLGFNDSETGGVIRLNMSVAEAQQVIGALMQYIDPMPADLQVCLERQGLFRKSG